MHGKRYRRIRYGHELWLDEKGQPYKDEDGKPYNYKERANNHSCHDCEAIYGQFHCEGCDVEQCPRCKDQHLSCDCRLMKDIYE